MTNASTPTRRSPRPVTGRMVLLCLIGFFGVVAAVNATMIYAAVATFGGLETESSYKAGLSFAREEAAARAQEARHWHVEARLRPETNGGARIDVTARDQADRPIAGLEGSLTLVHPTNRKLDHTVALSTDAAGRFHGFTSPVPGQWDLVVELSRDGERLFRSRQRVVLQ